ncbi:MAG: hypothetical protein ACLRHV_13735 [Enterococcus gallinarum]
MDHKQKIFFCWIFFDQTPGVAAENPSGSNPSKLLLYQDILYGLYEKTFREVPLTQHYEELAQRLAAVTGSQDTQRMFRFYHQLAVVLALKASFESLDLRSLS